MANPSMVRITVNDDCLPLVQQALKTDGFRLKLQFSSCRPGRMESKSTMQYISDNDYFSVMDGRLISLDRQLHTC